MLEKLVILLLHCVLMAGMSFQLELAHDFWPELHCTRSKQLVETLGTILLPGCSIMYVYQVYDII